MSSIFSSKTMATLFIMVIQCIAVNSSVFSPPTIDFDPSHDLRRFGINLKNTTTLTVDKSWRSWLLTNSSVTDIQFQNSLSVDLKPDERAPHVLVREIFNQFPSIILSGEYVLDVVINNEKSLTGSTSLDFNLNVDNEFHTSGNIFLHS